MVRRRALKPILFAILLAAAWFHPAIAEPLNKIGSIALGSVAGPINALALDYANQRLFVLEGGAGQLIVVDLATGSFIPIANDAPDITAVAGSTVTTLCRDRRR